MNELQRQVLVARQIKFSITKAQNSDVVSEIEPYKTPLRDKRYRILVSLMRSDRPRYWNFLCANCGHKVVELQNCDIYGLDDFYDPQDTKNMAVGKNCVGKEKQCPYTYFFMLH